MNCAELETLICDYVDGTLAPAQRAEVETHLVQCPGCAEMARDSAAAVAFMARAAGGGARPAQRAEVETHLVQCPGCAEMARDSAAAVAFMARAADVEPPPELITRILFDAPWSKGQSKPAGVRRRLGSFLGPMLHPKFAMGMAMTILSFSLLKPFVAPGLRQ